MSRLLVIATGGTIDSAYPPDAPTPDYVPTPETSAIPSALAAFGLAAGEDYTFVRLGHLDSKQVDAGVLHRIAACIEAHPECDRVMITHGTDTAPRNARYLEDMLPHLAKAHGATIVLCTAMAPLRAQAASLDGTQDDAFRSPEHTDAWDSLRTTLAALQTPHASVRIAAGNDVMKADATDKHRVVTGGTVTDAEFVGRIGERHPDRDVMKGW